MPRLSLPLLCAVACTLPTAVSACGDAATLLGTHEFELADRPLLLRVDQNGSDLLLAVDAGAGTTLFNHPNDRGNFELVLLQPADGAVQQVCVHSAFRAADVRADYRLSVVTPAAAELAALERFSEAGRLWMTADTAARMQAAEMYRELAQTGFPWRAQAALYALRARLHLNQTDAALAAMATLPAQAADDLPYVLPWYRGMLELRRRDWPAAISSFSAALELGPQGLDRADIANLLGEALVSAGSVDEGEAQLLAAQAAAGADHSLLARIHNNLGYVLLRRAYATGVSADAAMRWLRASIDEHLAARAFAVNSGDASEQLLIDNNLGTLYERVRELRKAQYHYREALLLTERAGDPYALRVIYQNLGALNQRLGDYLKSRGYLAQALRLAEEHGDASAYRVNCMLGTTYRLLGALPEALAIHEDCRSRAAAAQDQPALIEALAELAEDHMAAQRSDGGAAARAWQTFGAARALVEREFPDVLAAGRGSRRDPHRENLCTGARSSAGVAGTTLAEAQLTLAARVLHRHALLAQRFAPELDALADLELAASIVGTARYSVQLDLLDTALRVYAARGNMDFALACGEAALALSERLHEDLEAERNGPAWTARNHELYVALADLLLAQQDDAAARAALAVAERGRGIALRQHLSLPRTETDEDESARLRATLNTLADAHAALSEQQKAALLPVTYYHQHDLVERARLHAQLRVPVPPALDAAAAQARLAAGQRVLYYYIGAGDAWLFTLDAARFSVQRLGTAAELAALVAGLEQELRSANGAPAAGLRALSAFLLPPGLQLDAARELLIVPHRALYTVPFTALVHAGSDRALIDDFAVKTLPSLTAYFMDKPAAAAAEAADLAIFADPLFNTADLRVAAAGPEAGDAALQTWSAGLERLPYTEVEAASLKALFGAERTREFVGNRATLANLASDAARNARILHVATHGYFRSTSWDNVGLVLSTIDERGARVPGFVSLTELFAHSFNNELVVISGCETALGLQLDGEGLMGIARGFLAQGARHVISTLWPVSDRASAQFMKLFYAHLLREGDVAEALRNAQRELKALPEFRHPTYWAAYVLTTVSPDDTLRFAPAALVTR